jgi:hypothetical protein
MRDYLAETACGPFSGPTWGGYGSRAKSVALSDVKRAREK